MLIYLELILLKNLLNFEVLMWRKFGYYDLCLYYFLLQGGVLFLECWRVEVDVVFVGVVIGVVVDIILFNLLCDEDIGFFRSFDGKLVFIYF